MNVLYKCAQQIIVAKGKHWNDLALFIEAYIRLIECFLTENEGNVS